MGQINLYEHTYMQAGVIDDTGYRSDLYVQYFAEGIQIVAEGRLLPLAGKIPPVPQTCSATTYFYDNTTTEYYTLE